LRARFASFALTVLLAFATSAPGAALPALATATFAGGCFWCMEPPYTGLPGVTEVMPGYTGGTVKEPSYEQVSAGGTGHAEAVRVTFDPQKVSYEKLLDVYWHQVDPTTPDAQFCDHGHQYRSAIFYHSEAQRQAAEASKATLARSGPFKAKIVTEITPAGPFYPAEEYHRQYYRKNPIRYRFYRSRCGRDDYLDAVWGKDRPYQGHD
jgi:peptide-methionine (S)-S-oxide reductase